MVRSRLDQKQNKQSSNDKANAKNSASVSSTDATRKSSSNATDARVYIIFYTLNGRDGQIRFENDVIFADDLKRGLINLLSVINNAKSESIRTRRKHTPAK